MQIFYFWLGYIVCIPVRTRRSFTHRFVKFREKNYADFRQHASINSPPEFMLSPCTDTFDSNLVEH